MSTDTATSHRLVDAGVVAELRLSHGALVKAGDNSVKAAWKFGRKIDLATTRYTIKELARAMNLSPGTLERYARLARLYARPEDAIAVSRQLETANIGLLCQLYDMRGAVVHARPLSGRRWRHTCLNCGAHEVTREEIDPETGELVKREADDD